jgi:hypothetical protein
VIVYPLATSNSSRMKMTIDICLKPILKHS